MIKASMLMTPLKKIRCTQFARQAGHCHYCEQPMWQSDPAGFAHLYGISAAQAGHLRATAEHLIARSDGGQNCASNIVAACLYCNSHRHWMRAALSPEDYQKRVRSRLKKGKWHGLRLNAASMAY